MKAITGREQFYYGELNRLVMAEKVVVAYHSRRKSENWAAWADDNPAMAKLLAEVEIEH